MGYCVELGIIAGVPFCRAGDDDIKSQDWNGARNREMESIGF
jgi:hypothetical protein